MLTPLLLNPGLNLPTIPMGQPPFPMGVPEIPVPPTPSPLPTFLELVEGTGAVATETAPAAVETVVEVGAADIAASLLFLAVLAYGAYRVYDGVLDIERAPNYDDPLTTIPSAGVPPPIGDLDGGVDTIGDTPPPLPLTPETSEEKPPIGDSPAALSVAFFMEGLSALGSDLSDMAIPPLTDAEFLKRLQKNFPKKPQPAPGTGSVIIPPPPAAIPVPPTATPTMPVIPPWTPPSSTTVWDIYRRRPSLPQTREESLRESSYDLLERLESLAGQLAQKAIRIKRDFANLPHEPFSDFERRIDQLREIQDWFERNVPTIDQLRRFLKR